MATSPNRTARNTHTRPAAPLHRPASAGTGSPTPESFLVAGTPTVAAWPCTPTTAACYPRRAGGRKHAAISGDAPRPIRRRRSRCGVRRIPGGTPVSAPLEGHAGHADTRWDDLDGDRT